MKLLLFAIFAVYSNAVRVERASQKCSFDGDTYNEGATWQRNHLRYKCTKEGTDIIGCKTDEGRSLEIGESFVKDNLAHQCFRKGDGIYYHMFTCGIAGTPDCDHLNTEISESRKTSDQSSSSSGILDQKRGLPAVPSLGLPEGWKIVDAKGNPVNLNGVSINLSSSRSGVGSTAVMHSITTTCDQGRKRREARRKRGVKKDNEHHQEERIVGVGTGSVDLDSRRPTLSVGTQGMKPGTVGGTRSFVDWNGKTENIGGRRIAVGPGTFTFGVGPTGAFVRPSN